MEYTLFQDFRRKIPRPAPPTGRPGRAQSGCTPEFGYGLLVKFQLEIKFSLNCTGIQNCQWRHVHHHIREVKVFICTRTILTLKEPGGGGILNIFCRISAICYFSRWNFMTFSFKPGAWFKTIFKKIGHRVMKWRCVIARWVQRRTDQKLILNGNYTQIVFLVFRIHFHYVLSYLFGLFGVRTCVSILWHTSLSKNSTFAWKNSEKPWFLRFLVILAIFRVFDMTSLWCHCGVIQSMFVLFWYQWTREGHSYPLVPHTWCFINRFPRY